MKIKVSEASGCVLDWMVTAAPKAMPDFYLKNFKNLHTDGRFHFSADWELGGPIIERGKIATLCDEDEDWSARAYLNEGGVHFGPTPLIAAMRCYVASKLGEEVEVPDELV